MSSLSNDYAGSVQTEQIVLEHLEKYTGLKAVQTPIAERIDFVLGDAKKWRVVGEIKTRPRFYVDGFFMADKKRDVLAGWEKICRPIIPWFVVHCLENGTIYFRDVREDDDDFEQTYMTNPYSTTRQSEWGRIVPISAWKTIEPPSVFESVI